MIACKFILAFLILLAVAPALLAAETDSASSAQPARPDFSRPVLPRPEPLPLPPTRETDRLAPDAAGTINIFPCTKTTPPMKALVYVPRYYDAGRSWPLLVEIVDPGRLNLARDGFVLLAESHGFILLTMECTFMRQDVPGALLGAPEKVWNRQGGGTMSNLSRPYADMLRDLTADGQTAVDLVNQIGARYHLARPSVAIAGCLGTSRLAYREVVAHPEIFNAVIVRTSNFHIAYMPRDVTHAVNNAICIVYGAKEPAELISDAKDAAAYFLERHFKHVTIEEIPNSGVDYRPEIVTNYFLNAYYEKAGPDRAAFDRAATRAGLCLAGEPDPDADPHADRHDIDPVRALAALDNFVAAHPTDKDLTPYGRFLAARLLHEKLHQDARAQQRLREFSKQPLLADPISAEALLYLVDKVLGPTTDREDSLALLQQVMDRYSIRPGTAARAKELIQQLTGGAKP